MTTKFTSLGICWRLAAGLTIALHVAFLLFLPVSDRVLNAWHLGLVLLLGFALPVLTDGRSRQKLAVDVLLGFLGFGVVIYFLLFEDAVFDRFELNLLDQFVAWLAVLLTLELTRRLVGWVIPVITSVLILYVLYLGPFFDGLFFFGGLSEYRMAYRLFWQDGALLGSTTTISATIIFMFVFLSVLMRSAGATEFIIDASRRLLRRVPGGSAHVAVISSAAMGSVSGSAVANVAGTGSITIPMMKRSGLRPEVAGGVEAAASTGSQLAPPVMGAGVFIMADWTGVPYTQLVALAIIPAILFFLSISVTIHLELAKNNLLRSAEEDTVRPPVDIRKGLAFLVPIGLLISLLVAGYSPVYSAAWASVAVVFCSFFGPHPLSPRRWPGIVTETLQTLLPTAIVLICAGMIVMSVETSGLVVALAQSLSKFGGGNALIVLALIAVISLFLGMGLPVTASYIVVASFAAAALTSLDVPLVAAHMAIFWLSQDSLLTPPVCLAAYAAAGIAGGNPAATGVRAMLLGKGLYIMPILFVFHGLLFTDGTMNAVLATSTGGAATVALAIATVGYWIQPVPVFFRFLIMFGALAILVPHAWVQVAGIALVLASLALSSGIGRFKPTFERPPT